MQVLNHLGVILDGNRRFAKKLMLQPHKGHEYGYGKIKKLFEWCKELDIKELTLYCFSFENFNRPKKEFGYLMGLFKKAFNELAKEKEKLKEIKVNFIGRLKLFPRDVQKAIFDLIEKTKNNGPYCINFAMAYSGRGEIVDAVKKIVGEKKLSSDEINEEVFRKYLYLDSDPDLIIRTSERRLSGFLLWQSAYSEILFLPDKLWPEFEKEDLIKAVEDFRKRDRRFGK